MTDHNGEKVTLPTKEQFDIMQNRIAMALAKREALVKSWTTKSSRPRDPERTDAELEEEDAKLFRPEPPYLGVGCPIPADFLVSEVEKNDKSLRAVFFSKGAWKASKKREEEDKVTSPKRKIHDEFSEEEEGRSSLGRAKKQKTTTSTKQKIAIDVENSSVGKDSRESREVENTTGTKQLNNGKKQTNGKLLSLATSPITPEKDIEKSLKTHISDKYAEQELAGVQCRESVHKTKFESATKEETQKEVSASSKVAKQQKRRVESKEHRKAKTTRKENALLQRALATVGYETSLVPTS